MSSLAPLAHEGKIIYKTNRAGSVLYEITTDVTSSDIANNIDIFKKVNVNNILAGNKEQFSDKNFIENLEENPRFYLESAEGGLNPDLTVFLGNEDDVIIEIAEFSDDEFKDLLSLSDEEIVKKVISYYNNFIETLL